MERPDKPIRLKTTPVSVFNVGEQPPVDLDGEYSDGAKLWLTNSTQVYGKSMNPSIATVDKIRPRGDPIRIRAISPRETIVVLGIGQGPGLPSVPISVTVKEPPPSGPAPIITGVSTNIGILALTQVTIDGENFGECPQGRDYVQLGNMDATKILRWTPTPIVAVVPLGSLPGHVAVEHNRLSSNALPFTTIVPVVSDVTPNPATVGQRVTITGKNFGSAQGSSVVRINNFYAHVISWTDNSIVATIPETTETAYVVLVVNEAPSNSFQFTVFPKVAPNPLGGANSRR